MVALTASQSAALGAIGSAWPEAERILVGALALGCHIDMGYRHTDDLDLAVSVSIDAFPGPLTSLAGWRQDPNKEHRFHAPEGQVVDVLPAGPALIAQGFIEWPSGNRMSLLGFDLAFAHAADHTIEPLAETTLATTVKVPSAPALAVLKMVAWLDRPHERTKDLRDLAHLLHQYVEDDDDRRWEEDILALDLDFEDVSPFALGRDLAAILESHHQSHVANFLERATPERLAAQAPAAWRDADHAERALAAFDRGLNPS